MHTLDGAGWCAPFFSMVFAFEIFHRVLLKRNPRIAPLLGTPVHLTLFTDVQVTRARPATPFVRFAFSDAVLKPIEARVILVAKFLYVVENLLFFFC